MYNGAGATYLEFGLEGFDLVIQGKKFAGQTAQEGNVQLLEYPPGVIALRTHHRKLVC